MGCSAVGALAEGACQGDSSFAKFVLVERRAFRAKHLICCTLPRCANPSYHWHCFEIVLSSSLPLKFSGSAAEQRKLHISNECAAYPFPPPTMRLKRFLVRYYPPGACVGAHGHLYLHVSSKVGLACLRAPAEGWQGGRPAPGWRGWRVCRCGGSCCRNVDPAVPSLHQRQPHPPKPCSPASQPVHIPPPWLPGPGLSLPVCPPPAPVWVGGRVASCGLDLVLPRVV